MKLSAFLFTLSFLLANISYAECGNGNGMAQQKIDSSPDNNEVDIDALLDAIGVPNCIGHCLNSLKLDISLILRFNGTFDHFLQTCQDLNLARKCIHSGACLTANIFDSVTSGLQSLCDDRKKQFILKNEKCLRGPFDEINQKCEQQCHLILTLGEFSHRSDLKGLGIVHVLGLLAHLDDVCIAADCFLPCFRNGLNSVCPKAGGVILDGLLRPFYQLANFIKKGGISMRKFVDEKVPEECHFLTEKEPLDKMVNPNKH